MAFGADYLLNEHHGGAKRGFTRNLVEYSYNG